MDSRREGRVRHRLLRQRRQGRAHPAQRTQAGGLVVPGSLPVHQAILQSLTKLADASCKLCEEKLLKQIERDEQAVRLPGARDLLGETRVALAVIQNKKKAN